MTGYHIHGRRLPSTSSEGSFPSDLKERRAIKMVTYEELFLFGTLIVSIIALVVNITKKK